MLNITHYQRNTNKNYNEISPHTGQNGYHQKNLQTINAGEDVEKREPSCTVGGNEIDSTTMEQQTASKQEKEYVKAVYRRPAYLTSMQSTL